MSERLKARRECKHGTFTFYPEDEYVGRSLQIYGEFSEGEIKTLEMILRPGDVFIDVGANIGVFTVAASKMVGDGGRVIAYEPSPENHELLLENVMQNGCSNVEIHQSAASDEDGFIRIPRHETLEHFNYGRLEAVPPSYGPLRTHHSVRRSRIDDLSDLRKVKLIKIDVEGMELDVLKGAEETIDLCRPILYVENDREEKSGELVAWLIDHGYRPYWHRPPLYNPGNHDSNTLNVFGPIVSMMMVCIPEEAGIEVKDLDEVADLRSIDEHMYDREIERYTRYYKRNPDDMTARLMVAHYQNLMQRPDKALELIHENLARDPLHISSLAIEGLMKLQDGDYKEGWQRYELRFQQKNKIYFGAQRQLKGVHWDGKPTEDVVLISAEQGFGDQIMFARFWREVLMRAPNAIFECHDSLYELFESSCLVPPGRLFRRDRKLPEYQQHCSAPSLPAMLGVDREERVKSAPYLRPDEGLIERWKSRGTARIGFCWAGSPLSERPFTRDIPQKIIEPWLRKHGPFHNLANATGYENFADTAACMSQLDLVITVDTSVAHLAGALGVPTWLLLSFDPDFRWGRRSDITPWYSTMTIWRQETLTHWQPVLDRISSLLEAKRMIESSEAKRFEAAAHDNMAAE